MPLSERRRRHLVAERGTTRRQQIPHFLYFVLYCVVILITHWIYILFKSKIRRGVVLLCNKNHHLMYIN